MQSEIFKRGFIKFLALYLMNNTLIIKKKLLEQHKIPRILHDGLCGIQRTIILARNIENFRQMCSLKCNE